MYRFIYLFSFSLISAQWPSFSLSELSNSDKELSNLYRHMGLAITSYMPVEIKDSNISLSTSLINQFKSNNLTPMFHGQIKASWNLIFRAKTSSFTSNNSAVQIYSWGLTLIPGIETDLSKWKILIDSGHLNYHDQLKTSALGFSIIKGANWNKINYHIGLSSQTVNVYPSAKIENKIFLKKETQNNYINVGTTKRISGLSVIIQSWLSPSSSYLSFGIGKIF